tara:strand:- start:4034 stop:4735 length:702 start_codon:yes stop_codon:yes gene_type:complete
MNILKQIELLPVELNKYVYNYVDYESKTKCLLNKNENLFSNQELSNNFTLLQLNKLYFKSVTEKFSVKNDYSFRRVLKDIITNKFPDTPSYCYVDQNGDEQVIQIMHPFLEKLMIYKKTPAINSFAKVSMFKNTVKQLSNLKCDIVDVNYILESILYKFIQSTIYYRNIILKRWKLKEEMLSKKKKAETFKKVVEKFEKKFVTTRKDFMLIPFHMKISKYYPVETWLNSVCYP